MRKIFIIGAGGFGREVLNILIDLNRIDEVVGFLEENCQRTDEILNGIPIYDIEVLKNYDKNEIKLVCAIGTPLRKPLIEKTKKMGYDYETLIHPSVIMSEWVKIGEGCIICAGTILTNQIEIKNHSIINLACTIGHDVQIGSYTTLSPGTNISGRVSIGNQCFIGTNVATVEKVSIGDNTFIGAGALVSKDIPKNVLAFGVPATTVKIINKTDWKDLI